MEEAKAQAEEAWYALEALEEEMEAMRAQVNLDNAD